MKHSCPGLKKVKMKRLGKPPHYFSPCIKQAPDGDELILTVMYMNKKDNVSIGWGMRFNYCPVCGEKLKEEKMSLDDLLAILRILNDSPTRTALHHEIAKLVLKKIKEILERE